MGAKHGKESKLDKEPKTEKALYGDAVDGSDAVTEQDLSILGVKTLAERREINNKKLKPEEFLKELKDDIASLKPLDNVNILVVGYVGAGKSSYINTINSHEVGYVSERAKFGEDAGSVTKVFRKYGFEQKALEHIYLLDTRGADYGKFGLKSTDFESLLDGKIKDNYRFRDNVQIRSGNMRFDPHPELIDKPHTVCFVYDGNNVQALKRNAIHRKHLKEFLDKISKTKGLNYIILLTKMDEVCKEVNADPSCVYTSHVVRDLVMEMAKYLEIAENTIVPVVNYRGNQQNVKKEIDILALIALRQMLRKAKDFLDSLPKVHKGKLDAKKKTS